MYGSLKGDGVEGVLLEPLNVVEIKIWGEPRAQENHLPDLWKSGRLVSYDPCLTAKRELKKLLRVALMDVGPTPGIFPIYKGRKALLLNLTCNATKISGKNASDLQAFVEDVLEGLVYDKRDLLCDTHMMKKPPKYGEPSTIIRVTQLYPELP